MVPVGFDGGFHVPSWGIGCAIDDRHVECVVSEATAWQAPPHRKPCDFDHAKEVGFDTGRRGHVFTTCRSDTPAGDRLLGYGHRPRVRNVRCTSERTELTCQDLAGGHGFTVSRGSLRGY